MKRLLVQAQPACVEDLIAIISLYRPGPMQFIPPIFGEPEKIRSPSTTAMNGCGIFWMPTGGCIISTRSR